MKEGMTTYEIATEVGVSRAAINKTINILYNRSVGYKQRVQDYNPKKGIPFSNEQIAEIVSKRKKGISLNKLAAEYKCSRTPIQRVLDIYMDDKDKKESELRSILSKKEILQNRCYGGKRA